MVLYLLNSRLDPSAKITWLVVIMLLPVFGALLFWYTQSDIGHRALKFRLNQLIVQTKESIAQSDTVMDSFQKEDAGAASLVRYMQRTGCFQSLTRLLSHIFHLAKRNGKKFCASLSRQNILFFWNILL